MADNSNSFEQVIETIRFARQCMATNNNEKNRKIRDTVSKVLSLIDLDAWLVTRDIMLIDKSI